MIEFTLSPDPALKEVAQKLQQTANTAPAQVQDQLRGVSQEHRATPPQREQYARPHSFREGRAGGQGAVSATAGDLEGELGELSSGRFSGLVERRIQGAQSAIDALKDKKTGRAVRSAEQGLPAGKEGAGAPGLQGQGPLRAESIKSLKVEKMELAPGAASALGKALGRAGGGAGALGGGTGAGLGAGRAMAGMGAGANAGAASAGLGGALQGAGASTVIPVLGLALGAAGAGMKLLSSASGMYQNLMQGQQGTLGTMQYLQGGRGLVVPGGSKAGSLSSAELRGKSNRYVRNAELAQIYSARARLSESGEDTSGDWTGVKFGLAQGLGGLGGASLFGELGRYGASRAGRMRSVFGAAELSGMGGLRQAEFFRSLSGMASQGVSAGFGRMDLDGVGGVMAGLGQGGLMGERAMSLTRSMHGQFQQKGSTLNSLALAAALDKPGTSIVEAMGAAEKGATRQNMRGVSGLLGLGGMDKESRQLLEMNVFGATATDVLSTKGGIAGAALSTGSKEISGAGGAALGKLQGRVKGQSYIQTQNVMDSLASTLEQSFELQQNIAKKLTGVMQTVAGMIDKLSGGIDTLIKRL